MLALSTLHALLSQVLSPPDLHTVALITNAGALISYATMPSNSKDHVRVVVGLSGEVWHETRDKQHAMVDSELGRILVLPVYDSESIQPATASPRLPLMLVCLNSTDAISWNELRSKGDELTSHLTQPLGKFKDILTKSPPLPKPQPQLVLR